MRIIFIMRATSPCHVCAVHPPLFCSCSTRILAHQSRAIRLEQRREHERTSGSRSLPTAAFLSMLQSFKVLTKIGIHDEHTALHFFLASFSSYHILSVVDT